MMNEKSVLQKLKNQSRKKKLSYQLILQLFCQEEFLRRLSQSPYSNNLILKGGLFLFAFNNLEGRPTMDIDFLGKDISNDQNEMKAIVEEIISVESVYSYIRFEIKSVENIAEQKAYHGVRLKLVAIIMNTKTPFDIDIGVGDVVVPNIKSINIPTQLEDFDVPLVKSYTLESTIAEKLEAMFSRMEATSRMKDYYDIFYLSTKYDFEGSILTRAIEQTFRNRETLCDIKSVERISVMYQNKDVLQRWNAFSSKVLGLDLKFEEVIKVIIAFVNEPILSIERGTVFTKVWYHDKKNYV